MASYRWPLLYSILCQLWAIKRPLRLDPKSACESEGQVERVRCPRESTQPVAVDRACSGKYRVYLKRFCGMRERKAQRARIRQAYVARRSREQIHSQHDRTERTLLH